MQFAWAIILVTGMLLLPETPRFLIKKGDDAGAARSLSRLRRLDVSHPALVEELAGMYSTRNHLTHTPAIWTTCLQLGNGSLIELSSFSYPSGHCDSLLTTV